MREPYDDIDPDAEEQRLVRLRERLQSTTCQCGNNKAPGERRCPECEWWECQEMARLNPPVRE